MNEFVKAINTSLLYSSLSKR